MNKTINLQDNLAMRDDIRFGLNPKVLPRTKIIAGYDPYVDKNGITQLGEVVFETENQIVLGGAIFILEKIFGIKSSLQIDTLNNIMGIATEGGAPSNTTENRINLFGVGIGGSGDTIRSVKKGEFYEREIPDMIPLRTVDGELQGAEKAKYGFVKNLPNGKKAYYLKKFSQDPVIRCLYKDGENDDDGSPVGPNPHTGGKLSTPIEVFVECVLQIDKKDVKEHFALNGNVEDARINSLALFTGILAETSGGEKDYKDVRMFSKLNLKNEPLDILKTLTFIYRIYSA